MPKNSIQNITTDIRTLSKICSQAIRPSILTEDTSDYFTFCLNKLPELVKHLNLIINKITNDIKDQQVAFLSCMLNKYRESSLISNKLNIESLKMAILTYHWIDFATCNILIRNIFTLRSCADNLKDQLIFGRLNSNNLGVRKLNTNVAQLHRLLIQVYPQPNILRKTGARNVLRVKRPIIQRYIETPFRAESKKQKKSKTQENTFDQ